MLNREEVLKEITTIFQRELSEPNLVLDYSSSANTVGKWDSINNLVLLTSIEEKYKISFSIDFILKAENVGDLCDYVIENASQQ